MADQKPNLLSDLGINVRGNQFSKLGIDKNNPVAASVISKLVRPQNEYGNTFTHSRRIGKVDPPNYSAIEQISQDTANNVNDALNLFQLLPDTELAQQILVSSILSPKDMVSTELNFVVDDESIDSEISGSLLKIVQDHFEKVYKIEPMLSEMLNEILFTHGSYPMVILPESTIDKVINDTGNNLSLENLTDDFTNDGRPVPIGLLGSPAKDKGKTRTGVSLESYRRTVEVSEAPVKVSIKNIDTLLTVTDNINVLKLPVVHSKMRHGRVHDILSRHSLGMEDNFNPEDLYNHRHYRSVPILGLTTPDQIEKSTVGHPLILKLAPEAVIPVHSPGNPKDHIGYFVLLDPNGYPIARTAETNYYSEISQNLTQTNSLVSQLTQLTRRNTSGDTMNDYSDPNRITDLYAQLVEENLLNRLRNGVYGDSVQISRPLDVYRIMLSRALARMNTQILYVPIELMTYMAFDYNSYGVGKSLLEDNKILASIRAMLLFANTMAAIKNSVGHVGLNIQLDPKDPDPASTVEFLIHEYTKHRQAAYPLGASSPLDIVNFLQNAGVDVKVSGNPAYPETRMDVEDRARSIVEPNTELTDKLKRDYLMSLGLSPETVDTSYSVEFATSVVSSNLLLTKRVLMYQDKFITLLNDFIRKYISYSRPLMERLKETVKNNLTNVEEAVENDKSASENERIRKVLKIFLANVGVSLPRPSTAQLENQMAAFDTYVEALEKALDAYFSTEFLQDMEMGDQADVVDSTKAAIKAYYVRCWMRENNVMPELGELTTFTKDDSPMIDLLKIHGDHIEAIGAALEGYMKNIADARERRNEIRDNIKDKEGIDITNGGGTDDNSFDTSEDTDTDLGDDDFGMDNDLGVDDDTGELNEEEEGVEPEEADSVEETVEPEAEDAAEEEDPTELKPDTNSTSVTGGVIQPSDE